MKTPANSAHAVKLATAARVRFLKTVDEIKAGDLSLETTRRAARHRDRMQDLLTFVTDEGVRAEMTLLPTPSLAEAWEIGREANKARREVEIDRLDREIRDAKRRNFFAA